MFINLLQGWSNGNIEYVPFEYTTKPKHDIFGTNLFGVNKDRSISGLPSMSATTNSLFDYLLN